MVWLTPVLGIVMMCVECVEGTPKKVGQKAGTNQQTRQEKSTKKHRLRQASLRQQESSNRASKNARGSTSMLPEERDMLLRKLARGVKETADQGVQTSVFSPVPSPGVRVILRYVHEPQSETFYVPDNECYHVYEDCYAFRHRGTREKVQRRRICQFCLNRASDDPDKTPDYDRDLERAREYERTFETTLHSSGQSSRVSHS